MKDILIIQDSPSANMMLKLRLESSGFSVDITETGEGGLEKAKKSKYKLVLLDIQLPGIDGLEVCKILKKEKETKDLPVVFISAKDEDELVRIVKEFGADGYIGIPFEGKKFIDNINKYMK